MSLAPRVISQCALFILVWASAAHGNPSLPQSIEIFTTSEHPVRSDQQLAAKTYLLDGLRQLELKLSVDLPNDEDQAKSIALQRLHAMREELHDDVELAVEGLSLAHAYGLRKLPAVVFDGGAYVVYGVANLDQALNIYQEGAGQ